MHPARRAAQLVAKLRAGQPVSVAYLGGSITAQPGWRVYSLQWLRRAWPDAEITEVNAAISGTAPAGPFRLQHDVLRHNPDLLFIEFAVNDSGYTQQVAVRGMEGIVRQVRRALPELDICFVYTLAFESMLKDLQAGRYPPTASAMEAVADHYGLPSIHLGLEIARLEAAGRLVFQGTLPATDAGRAALGDRMLFSEDGVHPLVETGHVVYGEVLARSLERIAETPGAQPVRASAGAAGCRQHGARSHAAVGAGRALGGLAQARPGGKRAHPALWRIHARAVGRRTGRVAVIQVQGHHGLALRPGRAGLRGAQGKGG